MTLAIEHPANTLVVQLLQNNISLHTNWSSSCVTKQCEMHTALKYKNVANDSYCKENMAILL